MTYDVNIVSNINYTAIVWQITVEPH